MDNFNFFVSYYMRPYRSLPVSVGTVIGKYRALIVNESVVRTAGKMLRLFVVIEEVRERKMFGTDSENRKKKMDRS